MAEKKRNPSVKAAIFKQTPKTYYKIDLKSDNKSSNILSNKESTLFHSTPNLNPRSLNPMELGSGDHGKIKPSRMLIYEDTSEEDEDFRSTPPNLQERMKFGTPGAPMKSRKDFEKKVLRPKKLVYNEYKENDNTNNNNAEDINPRKNQLENNITRFYHSTPKRSEWTITEEKEEDLREKAGDFYYDKFINATSVIPRKIIPIIEEDENDYSSVYPNNQQINVAAGQSRSVQQQDRNKSRNKGSRKKSVVNNEARTTVSSKSRIRKFDLSCDKENNALQVFATEKNDVGKEESAADSLKIRSTVNKNDRNKEEYHNLSKTHFRI